MDDAELLKEWVTRLQQILEEMEDYQIKLLALQAEAVFLNFMIKESLPVRKS